MISVIIPVYNTEKYLTKCLESVCNQTYRDLEILIINDGSTDNSEENIFEYLEKDRRIKYFKKANEGQGVARNFGLDNATGDWISFVDSDDWLNLETYEKLLKYSDSNVDLFVFGMNRNHGIINKPQRALENIVVSQSSLSLVTFISTIPHKKHKRPERFL